MALDDAASIVCMLNPTGGLVGGDRLVIDVGVGAGRPRPASPTPSATKVYRTVAGPAEQTVRLTLAPGARLEWVPDHTIPFARSAFRQRVEAEAPEGAALVLIDAFAAGSRGPRRGVALRAARQRAQRARRARLAAARPACGSGTARPGPASGWPRTGRTWPRWP